MGDQQVADRPSLVGLTSRIACSVPTVLLALLGVAWLVSSCCAFGYKMTGPGRPNDSIGFVRGSVVVTLASHPGAPPSDDAGFYGVTFWERPSTKWLGRLLLISGKPPWLGSGDYRTVQVHVPIAFLFAALLPLAFGTRVHFRFPLWSFMAYGVLLAVILAFYLPSAAHF